MEKLHLEYCFIVAKGCGKDEIEAPWLGSMGFTYKKQTPKWLDSHYHSNHPVSVPTGGHISFYCANNWERPKKDVWDSDNSDGLIKGFCSHKGQVSVAMTPSSKSAHNFCLMSGNVIICVYRLGEMPFKVPSHQARPSHRAGSPAGAKGSQQHLGHRIVGGRDYFVQVSE